MPQRVEYNSLNRVSRQHFGMESLLAKAFTTLLRGKPIPPTNMPFRSEPVVVELIVTELMALFWGTAANEISKGQTTKAVC